MLEAAQPQLRIVKLPTRDRDIELCSNDFQGYLEDPF